MTERIEMEATLALILAVIKDAVLLKDAESMC
jgi:hypothetical protein